MDWFFLPHWPLPPSALAWVALLLLSAVLAGEAVRRWLHLPRLLGYVLAGIVLGPEVSALLDARIALDLRIFLDVALGLLLFEVGQRIDLGWLRRNPWLFGTSVLESALSFAGALAVLLYCGLKPIAATLAALLAMSTSPAVIMTVVKDLRAQGQLTERLLLLTALNTVYAVLAVTMILAWLSLEYRGDLVLMIAHPLYLGLGSLLLSAVASALTLGLLRWFGRRPNVQFTLVVGAVLGAVALSNSLRLSVPLTMLAYGVFTRVFDYDRRFVSFRLGEGAMLFVVMLFALSALSLDFSGGSSVFGNALALASARFAGKAAAVTLLARPSGLGWRKAVLLAAGLTPLSALGLILFLDVVALYPQITGELGPTLHVAIAMLAVVGPVATQFAIRRAGEAAEHA